jgi:hypothetical protein
MITIPMSGGTRELCGRGTNRGREPRFGEAKAPRFQQLPRASKRGEKRGLSLSLTHPRITRRGNSDEEKQKRSPIETHVR